MWNAGPDVFSCLSRRAQALGEARRRTLQPIHHPDVSPDGLRPSAQIALALQPDCPHYTRCMTAHRVSYSVIVSLPTAALATEYLAWLLGGHVDAVIRGGASSGEVVVLDSEPSPSSSQPGDQSTAGGEPITRVMAHYVFPSREVFDRYVRLHAPALRAEGLARFGPSTGVTYQRLVGEIQ